MSFFFHFRGDVKWFFIFNIIHLVFFSQVQYSFTLNLIYNKNVTSIFSSFVCHVIHVSYKNLLKSKFNGKIIIFHFSSIFKKLKVTPNFLFWWFSSIWSSWLSHRFFHFFDFVPFHHQPSYIFVRLKKCSFFCVFVCLLNAKLNCSSFTYPT